MTTVLYHDGCNDGLTAAWVLSRALHDVTFIGCEYKNPPPIDACIDEDVICADVSWAPDEMMDLLAVVDSFQLYDHHDTAMRLKDEPEITDHENMEEFVLDQSRSAARIVWDEYGDDTQLKLAHKFEDGAPRIVRHVEDRDLWRNELEHTPAISELVYTFPRDVGAFERAYKFLEFDYQLAIGMGEEILELKEETSEALLEYANENMIGDHAGLVVRGYSRLASILGNKLARKSREGVGATWWPDDGGYKLSLRSTEEGPNVAEIAEEEFGGGGHPEAAGAWVEELPFGW